MIYERVMLEPLAFIFSVCSCSSLSHPTQQFCLGWQLFIELRQLFPIGSLIQAAMCLQVEPEHSLPQIPMPGEIRSCFGNMNLDKSLRIVELVFLCLSCVTTPEKNFRYWVGWHCIFFLSYIAISQQSLQPCDLTESVWQFQRTRCIGGRVLLTSVRPGSVDTPCCTSWPANSPVEAKERSTWVEWVYLYHSYLTGCDVFFSIFPCMSSKKISRSCLDMQHLHTWA